MSSGNLSATLDARIAELDERISTQLSAVMHAPEFQKLEASWRDLDYLMSTAADALLQGKNELQLAAGGAAVQISGGNITLVAPGKVGLKAGSKNFTEAKSA